MHIKMIDGLRSAAAVGKHHACKVAPVHLSSLVERDRLSMHMHAAARMDGCGSDSAAAICAEDMHKSC